MTKIIEIDVANDFSRYPSGRYPQDSKFSGEKFRNTFLTPHLRDNCVLRIQLDGTLGYGSSFLDEAFGGLVRIEEFSPSFLMQKIILKSNDDSLKQEILEYLNSSCS